MPLEDIPKLSSAEEAELDRMFDELRPGHEFLVPAARDDADQYRKIIEAS